MPISREILQKYVSDSKIFVESGTYEGQTTELANYVGYSKIYTIELSEFYYSHAKEYFASNPNITCILGDSAVKLRDVLNEINEPVVFWLDGHFSGGQTACGNVEIPIYEELDVIAEHHIKNHTILIDDIRLIGDKNVAEKGWSYLSLEKIVDKCKKINNEYTISFEDDDYSINDILVARIVV